MHGDSPSVKNLASPKDDRRVSLIFQCQKCSRQIIGKTANRNVGTIVVLPCLSCQGKESFKVIGIQDASSEISTLATSPSTISQEPAAVGPKDGVYWACEECHSKIWVPSSKTGNFKKILLNCVKCGTKRNHTISSPTLSSSPSAFHTKCNSPDIPKTKNLTSESSSPVRSDANKLSLPSTSALSSVRTLCCVACQHEIYLEEKELNGEKKVMWACVMCNKTTPFSIKSERVARPVGGNGVESPTQSLSTLPVTSPLKNSLPSTPVSGILTSQSPSLPHSLGTAPSNAPIKLHATLPDEGPDYWVPLMCIVCQTIHRASKDSTESSRRICRLHCVKCEQKRTFRLLSESDISVEGNQTLAQELMNYPISQPPVNAISSPFGLYDVNLQNVITVIKRRALRKVARWNKSNGKGEHPSILPQLWSASPEFGHETLHALLETSENVMGASKSIGTLDTGTSFDTSDRVLIGDLLALIIYFEGAIIKHLGEPSAQNHLPSDQPGKVFIRLFCPIEAAVVACYMHLNFIQHGVMDEVRTLGNKKVEYAIFAPNNIPTASSALFTALLNIQRQENIIPVHELSVSNASYSKAEEILTKWNFEPIESDNLVKGLHLEVLNNQDQQKYIKHNCSNKVVVDFLILGAEPVFE